MAETSGERVNLIAILGDQRRVSRAPRLAGGRLVAVVSDIRLDLRAARPVPEGATVTVVAIVGDIEIVVPPGWVVDVGGTAIVGDFTDRTGPGEQPASEAPRLAVRGLALLGEVTVHHAD
jgi:hypothetical protein